MTNWRQQPVSLILAMSLLVLLFAAEWIAIISLNDGRFTYTLDDPYIHLALAENLLRGHYGVNALDYSAASSSILWPFLLAPFSGFAISAWLLNVLSAFAVLWVFWHYLNQFTDPRSSSVLTTTILCIFIFASNLVGLSFTGMEHTLQVLAVALIALGLVRIAEGEDPPKWLPTVIVLAPLVRYENLAVSAAAIGFLLLRRHFRLSMLTGLCLLVALVAFSLFLMSLGLGYMPSSVVAKNAVVQMNMQAMTFLLHFQTNMSSRAGVVLLIADVLLVVYALLPRGRTVKRQLAICTALAIFLHLIVGRSGWYNRYEIYMVSFTAMMVLYLAWDFLRASLAPGQRLKLATTGLAIAVLGYACVPYVRDLFTLPVAANNVYEQHYQMHRFAVDFYGRPVAVNDLGYVAYGNPNYVLDLWGLGSSEALQSRLSANDYLTQMPAQHDVGLAMIYEGWFADIPPSWEKVAEMSLSRQRITPAEGTVAFYVIEPQLLEEIRADLKDFMATLPAGMAFNVP